MTVTQIALMTVMLLYIGNLSITFHPFEITFYHWHRALGALLMILGIMVYGIGEHRKGNMDDPKSSVSHWKTHQKLNNVNTKEKITNF